LEEDATVYIEFYTGRLDERLDEKSKDLTKDLTKDLIEDVRIENT
jgi:hypothetical protein